MFFCSSLLYSARPGSKWCGEGYYWRKNEKWSGASADIEIIARDWQGRYCARGDSSQTCHTQVTSRHRPGACSCWWGCRGEWLLYATLLKRLRYTAHMKIEIMFFMWFRFRLKNMLATFEFWVILIMRTFTMISYQLEKFREQIKFSSAKGFKHTF